MKKDIFRKKSIDRISSPEQLNNYLCVVSPEIWMILTAVILVLAGVCVWGIFGSLDTVIRTGAVCSDGELVCYITEEDAPNVSENMKVTVNGNDYTVISVSSVPVQLSNVDEYLLHVGGYSEKQWVFEAEVETELADGIYAADITIESVNPMSFLIN